MIVRDGLGLNVRSAWRPLVVTIQPTTGVPPLPSRPSAIVFLGAGDEGAAAPGTGAGAPASSRSGAIASLRLRRINQPITPMSAIAAHASTNHSHARDRPTLPPSGGRLGGGNFSCSCVEYCGRPPLFATT